jgi:hypothetical protein
MRLPEPGVAAETPRRTAGQFWWAWPVNVHAILKLDYEKAHDKVSIEFLEEILKQRGFSQKWLDKIHCLLHKGYVGIQINDQRFEAGRAFCSHPL